MRTKFAIYTLLMMLMGITCAGTFTEGGSSSAETETATTETTTGSVNPAAIAKEPDGKCCLTRIHKRASGQRSLSFDSPYLCGVRQIALGRTKIKLILGTEGGPCDEGSVIPNNSVLEATGSTYRRVDGFADFSGDFVIKNPAGTILFEGTIELMDRLGTHHSPFGSEACDPREHFEGWLIGKGSTHGATLSLRALIVGRAGLPATNATVQVNASIDGTIIRCP